MKLFHTPTSPFVRKVMVAAHELGVESRIETTFLRPTPVKADPELSRINPLSKIPALVLENGTALFDSRVICEYLQTLAAPERAIVPAAGLERFRVLRTQALCDGILEAGVAVFYERTMRPQELHWKNWLDGQTEKARQGLDELERQAPSFGDAVTLGQICAAVTFAWFEFRSPIGDVRTGRPELTRWYERFAQRPSMHITIPHT